MTNLEWYEKQDGETRERITAMMRDQKERLENTIADEAEADRRVAFGKINVGFDVLSSARTAQWILMWAFLIASALQCTMLVIILHLLS